MRTWLSCLLSCLLVLAFPGHQAVYLLAHGVFGTVLMLVSTFVYHNKMAHMLLLIAIAVAASWNGASVRACSAWAFGPRNGDALYGKYTYSARPGPLTTLV